ncbi:36726_t:CDS:2, partial [Gigaspora margarita]
ARARPIYISEEKWCSWCNMNNETCECRSENNRIWFEESDYCESCSMLKLYCYCGAIVGWSIELIIIRKTAGLNQWNIEKIECSICSTKKWIKSHFKGQRCPKSEE